MFEKGEGIYFGAGVIVGAGGFYLVLKTIILPRVQVSVENAITARVETLFRERTGLDPSVISPLVRREAAAPIAQSVVEAF